MTHPGEPAARGRKETGGGCSCLMREVGYSWDVRARPPGCLQLRPAAVACGQFARRVAVACCWPRWRDPRPPGSQATLRVMTTWIQRSSAETY
jgi:hypothetical protein